MRKKKLNIISIKTCKDCKYWGKEWFRKPTDDPDKGLKYCNHGGFYYINEKGIKVHDMKWACLLTGPDSLPDSGEQCMGFESS